MSQDIKKALPWDCGTAMILQQIIIYLRFESQLRRIIIFFPEKQA